MSPLLSFEEAQRLVLERAAPLGAETVALEEAAGRVLAQDAAGAVDLPPFPSSAMDGFALRADDAPGRLPVVERVAAGRPATRALAAGEAMAIATGGVVPEGADAVIRLEDVVESDNSIEITRLVRRGENVRPRGGDLRRGDGVVEAGTRLASPQLGALAAAGVVEVAVARRPRAAVLSTGTELRSPGEPLPPGAIYDANGVILSAALASAGADVERLASVEDDPSAHRAALERALAADVVLTSGGVSVGPHDLVRSVGAGLGVEEIFWGVAVKPGKPLAFGVRGGSLVFGLPGNPVSALVGFELFVRPAVLALQGSSNPLPRFEPGRLVHPVRASPDRDQLLRARMRPGAESMEVEPLAGQDSHMIARAAAADALLLVPRGTGELSAGSSVRYLRL